MFFRILQKKLEELANDYPIVTVLGPRQSGKTTLVKETFKQKAYINLEDLEVRALAVEDPKQLLKRYPEGAILDEIQRVPSLLSYIQVLVDEKQINGLYILTGSHQFLLYQAVNQSLAGRTALLNLLPMSIEECKQAEIGLDTEDYLFKGFYPRVYKNSLDPVIAYRSYIQTYIERDVRDLIAIKDLHQFQNFLKLCASRIGQILNMESLGNELGISNPTIKSWLSILEASFVIVRLQPYFENFGKRVIKSPKLYFVDVGIASNLLGIESKQQLERDPLRGHLFENLAVMEVIKARLNRGLDPHMYFYRDSNQNEIDIVLKKGNSLIPIEIKASSTFNAGYLQRLKYFKSLVGERCIVGYVVYNGENEQKIQNYELINYKNASKIVLN
jgi:predicted AAA+ superfamily ATPase